jgi:predicted Zn finger-like uncharacterized protein
MFTVCPKCTLTLVVTTVDLRAGQGYVRCGRCANVFNALIALREGDPATGVADTANRRLQQTTPPPSTQPALGAGVAMDPEPEPSSEPTQELQPEPAPDPEPAAEPEPPAEPEILIDPIALLEPDGQPESNGATPAFSNDEPSLEFDAAATDVSDIFISPSEVEHDTVSGNYEAVVLGDDGEPIVEGAVLEFIDDDPSHTDTVAAAEWSLLDDEPVADAESVIEESPLVAAAEEGVTEEPASNDPPWVEEMFAEAEAEAERVRTAEREALGQDASAEQEHEQEHDLESELEPGPQEDYDAEPGIVGVARASTGVAAPTETVLEPLLAEPADPRPRWQYAAGIGGLLLLLALQAVHFNRQSLVLNQTVGPALAKVYGWFNVSLIPRWDLTAYSVKQLGADVEGGEGSRLRVRLSLQNDSERVQPLPLLRLTLQDRYGNAVATRDLEPRDYLPPKAVGWRLLEPDQRIDAELHVVDPGRAASNFEIDACLRGESGAIGCASDARPRTAG